MSRAADLAKMGEVLTNSQIGGRRNIVINSGMKISQRATQVTGLGAADGYHTLDRWNMEIGAASAGRFTMDQIADGPSGFANALKLTTTTADTSIAAGEFLKLEQRFEGQDLQQFKKGTSDAEKVTVSFYVKGDAAATYTCELEDVDNTRSINQAFAVTTSWTRVILTFAADTSDPLGDDANNSLQLNFWLHGGTTYSGGTFVSNAWKDIVENTRMAESHTSIFDTTNRTFFITGVQMEVGSVATPFEHRSFGEELALCQRYFHEQGRTTTGDNYEAFCTTASFEANNARGIYTLPVTMRTVPSLATSGSFVSLGGSADAITAIALTNNDGNRAVSINVVHGTGNSLTAGESYQLRSNDDADASLEFDAELQEKRMVIENAKYQSTIGKEPISVVSAKIDDVQMSIPMNSANRHYAAIVEWAKIDGNTIEDAD